MIGGLSGRRGRLVRLVAGAVAWGLALWWLIANLPFQPGLLLTDYESIFWYDVREFIAGRTPDPADPLFLAPSFYPAPYQVMLAPLAVLPIQLAAPIAGLGCVAALAATLWWWAPRPRRIGPVHALLALSLPVIQLVWLGHLATAISLAAFSLALWAQRRDRWWLVGAAVAVGCMRTGQAPAVLAALIALGWGRWRQLGAAVAAGACVLIPLTLVAFVLRPQWVADQLEAMAVYPFGGFEALVARGGGIPAVAAFYALSAALAVWLVWPYRGRPLTLDRGAALLALTAIFAPVSAAYAWVFALPALVRLHFGMAVIALVVPWALQFGGVPGIDLAREVGGPMAATGVGAAALLLVLRRGR